MKEIKMFESKSGMIFDNKEKALKEDVYWDKVQEILKLIPNSKNLKNSYSNGEGYLQCDEQKVEEAKKLYLKLTSDYFNQKFTSVEGVVGRYVSDSNSNVFNELQYKLCSIDKKYRMWGQIYFALNPSKGTEIKLN